MIRLCMATVLAFSAASLAGCHSLNRQPRLSEPVIAPDRLTPGQNSIITVKVKDRFGIVAHVEGRLQQDPKKKFVFQDDGVAPDKTARDGVWTTSVAVPANAPEGNFVLDISGRNKRHAIITVLKDNREQGPLTVSCPFSIELPQP
ncbi:MAG TPA: hypothetical protein PLO62_02915 [Candidatus Hydrogenedentes bacterium]|nr:hypothetical protein [Candidatus Hydrogenedentota bacterium]HOS01704.1 hypothetical protein [Candidatus Hydrogenedentota bacterium]